MVPSCGDCPRFVAKHLSVAKDVVPACLVLSSGEFHGDCILGVSASNVG